MPSRRGGNGYATKSQVIAEDIQRGIRKGLYVDRMPSVHALAAEYGVNFKTVHKAVTALAKAGVLESSRGHGTVVAARGRELAAQGGKVLGERLVLFFMEAGGDVYGKMYDRLVARLNRAHLFPVVIHEGDEAKILRSLGGMNPVAMVIDRGWQQFPYETLQEMDKGELRIVFVHRMECELQIRADYVLSDYVHGGYIATRHLIERGHKRILLLGNKPNPMPPPLTYRCGTGYQVVQGYRLALEEADLLWHEMCLYETADLKDNQNQLRALLSNPSTRPTGIIANADHRLAAARGVIKAAGLKVPDDLALVGYYNTPHCEHFEVPLTSVSIREDELARIAAQRIVAGGTDRERLVVKPALVIRASSGGA